MQDTPNKRSATPRLDAIRATTQGTWVRHGLVDIAGDLVAGVLLSQIAYWAGWDRQGESRLTIERGGHRWLAKAHAAWWDECRVTEDQARRSIATLRDRGLIETQVWKFNGTPMVHVRLVDEAVEEALSTWDDPESTWAGTRMDSGNPADGPGPQPESSSLSETTAETTAETTVGRAHAERLAGLLADLMVQNGCRRPRITASGWLDPIRLLIDKDEVDPERVERAIRWSQRDEFWRANIHSGKKLREKFDTLRQQAARPRPGRASVEAIKTGATAYLEKRGHEVD